MAWMLLLEAGCIGTFLSLDLFLFFICFEIVLVPMYFIIGQWGHGDRVYAATKFFLFTMLGSAFMLVGDHRDGGAPPARARAARSRSTSSPSPRTPASRRAAARWLFVAFAIAFAVKVPLFPVHTWLPDAHTDAPTAGSVILAGVMLKLGTYGFIRYGLYLFPEATVYFAPVLITLGVIGIIVRRDRGHDADATSNGSSRTRRSRTSASSSSARSRSPRRASRAASLQMINHGISTGALFLLVGHDLRAPAHARDRPAQRACRRRRRSWPAIFTLVMLSSIGRARAQRLRRRVPDPHRLVPHAPLVDGRRRRRASSSLRSTCCGPTSACSTASPTKPTPR